MLRRKNMERLTDLDLDILRIIQDDARISLKNIAEKTYVSAPTVASRIDFLTEIGVIKGYCTKIEPKWLGNNIKTYINMESAPATREELYEFLRSSPHVVECCRVTGEYSLLLEAHFADMEELNKFLNQAQHFGRTETQIVFSTVIDRRGLPIERK